MKPDQLSWVRRRAWDKRREMYGPRGYAKPYRQAARCESCKALRAEVASLKAQLSQTNAETLTCETYPSQERA